jgi:hypothetical protein
MFSPAKAAVYHLGDFGTAPEKLKAWSWCPRPLAAPPALPRALVYPLMVRPAIHNLPSARPKHGPDRTFGAWCGAREWQEAVPDGEEAG